MPSVGAVTSNLNIVTKTADYNPAAANDFVLMDATAGPKQVTLPATPVKNTIIAVKKSDASTNAVSILPGAGANLNGDTSALLAVQGASATFQYDGTNWQLLATGTINTANTSAGLPAGGTATQVLTKNSGTNYDAGWTTASSGGGGGYFHPWATGRSFFGPPATSRPTSSGLSSNGTTQMAFFPVRIPNACTVSSVSVFMGSTGTAGLTLYLAMYSDVPTATSGGPALRLAGGNVASSATANAAVTVSMSNYVFSAGTNIWFQLNTSGTPPMVSHAAGGFIPMNLALNGVSAFTSTGGAMPNVRYMSGQAWNSTAADVSTFATTVLDTVTPLFMFTIA